MHKTKNDLSESTRKKSVELLNQRLADCLDLASHAKQAHWNVKGPNFIALHELFDAIATLMFDSSDVIAERATALGGTVEGTSRVVAERTQLQEYPLDIFDGLAHVQALSTSLAKFGKMVRENIDQTDEWGDKDTADLFTGISREVDKQLWFVEAHLQADK